MTKSKGIHLNRAPRGQAEQFFFEQIQIETEKCLDWSYLKRGGYGEFRIAGLGDVRAHNLALQIRVKKPNINMLACHTCHNRSCFNYRHLYWGTHKDNALDKIKDGTMRRGSENNTAKLNIDQVRLIRKDIRTSKVIASEYGVSKGAIIKIKSRANWAWVQP